MPSISTYSPLAVANWFIERARRDGEQLDPMKLIKLVYLGHSWHLATRGEPLINENVEAWPYGPVIPTVYHAFKKYGSQPIERAAVEVSDKGVETPTMIPGDTESIDVLEKVWEVYRGFSGIELSTLTHQDDSPWAVAREKAGPSKVRGVDIPDDLIQDHFIKLAERYSGGARAAS